MGQVGDKPGHPFRGNQYKASGRGTPERAAKARGLLEQRAELEARRQVHASGRAVYSMSSAIRGRAEEIRKGGREAPGHYAASKEKVQAAVEQAKKDLAAGYPGDPLGLKQEAAAKAVKGASPEVLEAALKSSGDDVDFRYQVSKELYERQKLSKGTPGAPDLAHLARENKIPAKIEAIEHAPVKLILKKNKAVAAMYKKYGIRG